MAEETTFRPGLEGVIAAETEISWLDVDHEQIVLRGYDLLELAQKCPYLSVAHLLIAGRLPDKEELTALEQEIAQETPLPQPVVDILAKLPRTAHPMDLLRTGLSALGPFDPDLEDHSSEATWRQSIRVLARVPQIIATGWRLQQEEPIVENDPKLGYSANFLYSITGKRPTQTEAAAFDELLAVYSEHELPNSTFAAIVVASTLTDLYSALVAGVASLKGPLHGGANEAVMHMLIEAKTPDGLERLILDKLAAKERIMGFGHRVYMHKMDPRAQLMKTALHQLVAGTPHEGLFDLCVRGEEVMHREKGLYPNLDYYAAPVYYVLGVPIPLYTPIFFAARTAGLLAHIREQYAHNRLFRPRVRYIGPQGLHL
ncbi:MAG: citrate synthase [Firmicutes bacterium]|nr:citrate synthase [Bacillota bacterium]